MHSMNNLKMRLEQAILLLQTPQYQAQHDKPKQAKLNHDGGITKKMLLLQILPPNQQVKPSILEQLMQQQLHDVR